MYIVQYATFSDPGVWKPQCSFGSKTEAQDCLNESKRVFPACEWRIVKATYEVVDETD